MRKREKESDAKKASNQLVRAMKKDRWLYEAVVALLAGQKAK